MYMKIPLLLMSFIGKLSGSSIQENQSPFKSWASYYDFTDRLMKYVESVGPNTHSMYYEYDTINNPTTAIEMMKR